MNDAAKKRRPSCEITEKRLKKDDRGINIQKENNLKNYSGNQNVYVLLPNV